MTFSRLYSFLKMCFQKLKRNDLSHINFTSFFLYSIRRTFHLIIGTYFKPLSSCKTIDSNYAVLTLSGKELYFPRLMGLNTLKMLLPETLDSKHWHYYTIKETTVHRDDVIADCGASEGIWALYNVDKVKKIFIIEPQTIFLPCLQKTFGPYLASGKVELLDCAVGDYDGSCSINSNVVADMGGMVKQNASGSDKIRKIDTLFSNIKITYLKADIEGFEFNMIKGATEVIRRDRPKIAITVYHQDNEWEEIKDYILSIIPEYRWLIKGLSWRGKPVLLHMWVN